MKQLIHIIILLFIGYSAAAQNWNFSVTTFDETCLNEGDGSIDISMSGTTGGFIFTWQIFEASDLVNGIASGTVGATNPDIKGFLNQGDYVVVVSKNASTEKRERNATIAGASTLLKVTKQVTSNNLCNGGNSGAIQVTATGGSGVYEYGLSFGLGATSPNLYNYSDNGGLFEGLSAGTYLAWVRDEFGCEKSNTSGEFAVTEPAAISIKFDTINADCNNVGGQIDLLSIAGGTPFAAATSGAFNYTVEWFDDEGTQLTAFDNQASLTGLDSGQYSVIITDKNGCTGSSQFELSKGFYFVINDIQNVSCSFDQDGYIRVKLGSDSENDESPFELRIYDSNNNEIVAQRKTNVAADSLPVFENLGPDTYRIEAESSGTGCRLSLTETLTQPNAPTLNKATMTPVACKTESTGSITFDVSGGSGTGYGYSVDGGTTYGTNPTVSGLAAGDYDLWIRDDSNCAVDVSTITVTEPARQWALSKVVSSDITCNGASDGVYTFEFNPAFSTDPIVADGDIKWINVNSNQVIATGIFSKTDLQEGEYRIDVTSQSGCYRALNFSISEPAALKINGNAPVFNCPESLTSTATQIFAQVSGGTQPYTFTWKKNGGALGTETTVDNATNTTLNGVSDNTTYTLFAKDKNGCETSKAFNIVIPDEIKIEVSSQVNVFCKGSETGEINIKVTGGTPNSGESYNFNWSKNGTAGYAFTQNLKNLSAGTYKVSVLDNKSCGPVEATVTITEPTTSYSLSGVVTPVICNGESNGMIDVTINRTTASGTHPNPTSIEWTKNGTSFVSGTIDLADLGPASYQITTVDDFGCSRSMTLKVNEYPKMLINPTIVQNACFGDSTGRITINPFGGYLGKNLNYSVRWFKNGTLEVAQNDKTSYTNLKDGNYRVEVTDSIGCKKDSVITLKSPNPIASNTTIGNIKCKGDNNGYLALHITGGTSPYIILWKKNNASGEVFSTKDSISNLAPGDYFVSIEDQNDCTPFTATYTITEPATEFNITLSPTEIKCKDDRNGQISVNITSGAGHPDSYSLIWYKDNAVLSSQKSVTKSAIIPISNLGNGIYRLEITDSFGCQRTTSYQLINPSQISFRPTIDSVTCNGLSDGTITIEPSGGYGNYSVTWSSEANGLIADTDFELGDVPAGKYKVSLTDSKGCKRDTLIFLNDPKAIIATPAIVKTTCVGGSDGSISITVSNGTAPYQYQWFKDGALISTDKNISELTEGTYDLSITDKFQCDYSGAFTLTDPPSSYEITGNIRKVACKDNLNGAIDITIEVSGDPDLDYTVYWEKNGVLFSQNTEDLNGVGHGEYEIFIEDQYGCQKSKIFSIENPTKLDVLFQVDNVSCFGGVDGAVSTQVSGGYGSYTYAWEKDLVSFPVTGSFANNLEAAFYRVTIRDLEGCALVRTVQVAEPDPFLISLTSKNNTCSTPFDSEINATVTGGVPPYAFQWLKDGLPYSKQEDLEAVPAGTYQMVAVDTNFCESRSTEVIITAPERLGVNVISQEDNLCPNTENGAISIQGTGGSFPYTYSFDSSAFSSVNNFVNLAGRDYLVRIQDDLGCTFDTLLTIRNQYELEAEFSLKTSEFAIDFPIALTDESLGEAIVSWLWDFGDTRASEDQNTSLTYETPGTYVLKLTVENEVGCTISKVDTLDIEKGFVFTVPTAFTPNGDGSNDTFRPGFQNVQSMDMKIQDKNGLVVFESNKISASWDGRFNGNDAPQGAYFYEITYTPKSGKNRKQSGKVVILR